MKQNFISLKFWFRSPGHEVLSLTIEYGATSIPDGEELFGKTMRSVHKSFVRNLRRY